MRPPVRSARVVLTIALLAGAAARADDRKVVWSDEARVTPPGVREFEQWVTWEHQTKDANNFNNFQFREEVELGINPRMQFGCEVAWHATTGPEDEKDGPRLDEIAGDVRYIILDPTKESFGLAVKPEIGISEDK